MDSMQRLLSPYQIQLHASRSEEVTPEVIIDRIKRVIVTDGDFSDKAEMDIFSIENYYQALAEEDARAKEFFASEVVEESVQFGDGSFDGGVRALRGQGPINWVVAALP